MTNTYCPSVYGSLIEEAQNALKVAILEVEEVATTHYSYVLRLYTKNDVFYLKKVPENFFIEVDILKKLQSVYCGNLIPEVIAINRSMSFFITKSCGHQTFRTQFSGNIDIELIKNALTHYKTIQKNSVGYVQDFLNIGVPDWRMSKFPTLYDDLVDSIENWKMWGIDTHKIAHLKNAKVPLTKLCEKLAAHNIPNSLNHSDFQDNNMVIDNLSGKITIIDWAETNISCPLLSLGTCLRTIRDRYSIPEESCTYMDLQNHFFDNLGLDKKELQTIVKQISILVPIYYVFTFQNLIVLTGYNSPSWLGKIQIALTEFLKQISNVKS